MDGPEPLHWLRWMLWGGGLLLLGLPLLATYCWFQKQTTRQAGDEAMARSWAVASRSFLGMTVLSWLLVGVGSLAVQRALRVLSELKRDG
ncbi:MAG: hypothetical protein IT204_14745 [Fimbriimonadaceae bacterium]|nr:hypothetical protein [Fimbriimonadaceae bacterium]